MQIADPVLPSGVSSSGGSLQPGGLGCFSAVEQQGADQVLLDAVPVGVAQHLEFLAGHLVLVGDHGPAHRVGADVQADAVLLVHGALDWK